VVTARVDVDQVRARVEALPDPELPMITLGELGVIRSAGTAGDGCVEVGFTPTFLGCPAIPAITEAIEEVLRDCGHPDGRVRHELTPAWTTDLITPSGREKLAAHGIAPPGRPISTEIRSRTSVEIQSRTSPETRSGTSVEIGSPTSAEIQSRTSVEIRSRTSVEIRSSGGPTSLGLGLGTPCPHCGSQDTRPHSSFGPTRCQSMLRCAECREIFPCITAT
jgi:ring-1,2-phenylacetyl-CoA epoxidase subunit PaaD